MSVAFCTFIKYDKTGTPVLRFIYWCGIVDLLILRSIKKVGDKTYTKEEYDAIDFESFQNQPCLFNSYIGWGHAEVFEVIPENMYDQWVKPSDDVLLDPQTSPAWIALCKIFSPSVQQRIDELVSRKLSKQSSMNVATDDYKDRWQQLKEILKSKQSYGDILEVMNELEKEKET